VFQAHGPTYKIPVTVTAQPPAPARVRERGSPPPPPRERRGARRRWGLGALAILVLALVVVLILFRWDWLRGPLARYLSGRLHRPVAITGHLDVEPWSWSPQATVTGLVIGNAPWAGRTPLASLPRLTVQAKILPLIFRGQLILPLVEVDRPSADLLRDKDGRANWTIHPRAGAKPLKLPAIDHLIIRDGAVRYLDERRRIDFAGTISSNEVAAGHGQGAFVLDGKGSFNGEAFAAHVQGGPLIHVDPNRPYTFDARISAGATRLRLAGRFDHPFDFGDITGRFTVDGPDLADLWAITGIALPSSPPYSLSAGFARRQDVYALRGIAGRVGRSDLEGALTVDTSRGRPMLTGDLASRRLRLADLVAMVGGAPSHASAADLSPGEVVEGARMKAQHRLLPDVPLDTTRVRGMDGLVTYHAAAVESGHVPIEDLTMTFDLDHGLLVVDPLSLTISQGKLAGSVRIDARQATQTNAIDLRLSDARLSALIGAKDPDPPIEGGLWARARLTGTGRSVREAAAHADGTVTAVMPGGALRKTIASLMGVDLGRTAFLVITRNKTDTPIRCAVADFNAREGLLTADRIVMDTGLVQMNGSGDVDLRDETLNLKLAGKPKKISLLRLNAPITLTGRLDAPKPGVDLAHAAPQVAGAVALGVLAAPLAAVLPFVAPGLAKNADCQALVGEAQDQGVHAPLPTATRPRP
jgi:uncharacterized protein involved in outer membrane biogenesis